MSKTSEERILLDENAVGDESRIREILVDWGVDKSSVQRLMKERRALLESGGDLQKLREGKCVGFQPSNHAAPGLRL